MLRLGFFTLFLMAFMASTAQAETRLDLDIEQSKLAVKSKALDEISRSFGQFVVVRDQLLNGTEGFNTQSKQWFTDASHWMNGWSPILSALEGDRLAHQSEADKATRALSQQLSLTQSLMERHREVLRKGQLALSQLQAIQRVRPDRVFEFSASAENFNSQVDQVQNETSKSLAAFAEKLAHSLEDLTKQFDSLLKLKIQKLALSFPELVNILKEVEQTITSIELVDVEVEKFVQRDAFLQNVFNKGQVFYAMSLHEDLKKEGHALIDAINSNSLLTAGAKANGVTRIQSLLNARENDFSLSLSFLDLKQRSISFYRNEVISPVTGMVRKCRNTPFPQDIDCALLRSIVFSETHLQQLTEGQLSYLETVISRVKKGPMAAVESTQGARPGSLK